MVTGAGRSGTSTVAGSLHHLGLKSPEPSLKANESNPRGFFEPVWSVKFHNRILSRAMVDLTDGRPAAAGLVADAVTPTNRRRLREWLQAQTDGVAQTVVKDPRSFWALDLWADVARDLDLQTGYLAMLRHPTAVHGSRATHYTARQDRLGHQIFLATNLTGWINANLIAERSTRGRPRVFVSYESLLSDWRTTMGEVGDALGLTFDADLSTGVPHEIDSFIDPALKRSATSWEGLDVPARLREIAEEVWAATNALGGDGDDAATRRMDDVAKEYAEYYQECEAVARYSHLAAAAAARREAEQEAAAERERAAAERKAAARQRAAAKKAAAKSAGASRRPPGLRTRIRRRVARLWRGR